MTVSLLRRAWLAALPAWWLQSHGALAAGPPAGTEVHGASDVYAEPGLALAWAVLRGPPAQDPADAQVWLRCHIDRRVHAQVEIIGRDPFGSARIVLAKRMAAPDALMISAPRRQFAEYPRTEVRSYAEGGRTPRRIVWFVGIPDTTPEYLDEAQLGQGLLLRLAPSSTSR